MTIQTETFLAAPSLAARFNALRSNVVATMKKRAVYHKTLAELEALSTRDLADLGIAPSMIREIAYEAAYGK